VQTHGPSSGVWTFLYYAVVIIFLTCCISATKIGPIGRQVRLANHRQPGRGLAVLMAYAVVVLQHETSTLRQRHNFISIDFKFGVGDYVREDTNPDKVGSGPMSGRDAMWGQHSLYGFVTFLFVFMFFNSKMVRDTRNVSMNHDYETGVAPSDSVNKTCVKRPLAEKSR